MGHMLQMENIHTYYCHVLFLVEPDTDFLITYTVPAYFVPLNYLVITWYIFTTNV